MNDQSVRNTYRRVITLTVRRSVIYPDKLIATLVEWHYRNDQRIGMHMHECQVADSIPTLEHRFAREFSRIVNVSQIDKEQPENKQPVPTTITWDIQIDKQTTLI